MNTKLLFIISFALLLWAGQAVAVGLPMAKKPLVDSKEFVIELQREKGKLNANMKDFILAFNELHPEIKIATETDLLLYVANLEVRSCPQQGKYKLSELRVDGTKRSIGWITRAYKKGERCWYDNNLGIFVGSADCGNIGREIKKSKPKIIAQERKVSPEYYRWVYGKEEPGVKIINVARHGTMIGYHEEIELKKTPSVNVNFNAGVGAYWHPTNRVNMTQISKPIAISEGGKGGGSNGGTSTVNVHDYHKTPPESGGPVTPSSPPNGGGGGGTPNNPASGSPQIPSS